MLPRCVMVMPGLREEAQEPSGPETALRDCSFRNEPATEKRILLESKIPGERIGNIAFKSLILCLSNASRILEVRSSFRMKSLLFSSLETVPQ